MLLDLFQIQYVKFNSGLILYDLTVFSGVYSVWIKEDSRMVSSISCFTFDYAMTMIPFYFIIRSFIV